MENHMQELVRRLNEASSAYYGGKEEVMTNFEWDKMFDELTALEKETGVVLPDSPTHTTSHSDDEDTSSNGQKEEHEFPALSLAKTKDIKAFAAWAEDKDIWLSWKLDGLTLVLTYDGGELRKIVTRGNGHIGTNITFMKDAIKGFPTKIKYNGHMVVRGEATISYPEFEAINAMLEDEDEKYANPRNLASGTLSLDEKHVQQVKERCVTFNAFTLVHIDTPMKSWGTRMDYLKELGFTTVEYEKTNAKALPAVVEKWTKVVELGKMQIPVDGLVISYDDTDYAATGSVTGHHATRAGYAFKWQDESAETTLDHIEWSCAASTITPVAVFRPVQLEGTTVTRASLCNLTELKRLGIGRDNATTLEIIKANKIIPKVIKVVKADGIYEVPRTCPVCGAPTEIHHSEKSNVDTLHCSNVTCPAKNLKRFVRFVSKEGMDIDGLSIQSLEQFINAGFIKTFPDIYHLANYSAEIQEMDGFGKRSCEKLLAAIEKSRTVSPVNFIKALCIPLVGTDFGKKVMAAIGSDAFFERLTAGIGFEDIQGIGSEKSGSLLKWYADEENKAMFLTLLKEVNIQKVSAKVADNSGKCAGQTFVITGDVHTFKNRDEFKVYVEANGGSVVGSVSKKTTFLVNNDLESASSKNVKAKQLNIPIISEDEFIQKFGH